MQYIKVKFLKNGQPSGRAYTYRTPVEVSPGDTVQIDSTKTGVVVDEPVDMEWVEAYGAEKIKSIAGKTDMRLETFDALAATEAQSKYCTEHNKPHFAPKGGRCWKCGQNIYAEGKQRNGNPSKGISVERAGRELITGCPHCNWSFCE